MPKKIVKNIKRKTKAAARKPVVKKRSVQTETSKKTSRKSAKKKKTATGLTTRVKTESKPKKIKTGPKPRKIKTLSAAEKKLFIATLLKMKERITGQIATLKGESLVREDSVNSEEDGTDAFDRQFALNLVSSEHDSLFEIDQALLRLEQGTYGQCESCGKPVEKARLKALPFVRLCINCQAEEEKNKPKYRSTPVHEEL